MLTIDAIVGANGRAEVEKLKYEYSGMVLGSGLHGVVFAHPTIRSFAVKRSYYSHDRGIQEEGRKMQRLHRFFPSRFPYVHRIGLNYFIMERLRDRDNSLEVEKKAEEIAHSLTKLFKPFGIVPYDHSAKHIFIRSFGYKIVDVYEWDVPEEIISRPTFYDLIEAADNEIISAFIPLLICTSEVVVMERFSFIQKMKKRS